MTYAVTPTREGRWWMVAIPEIDGLTQARDAAEIGLMPREYIAVTLELDLADVEVEVTVADGQPPAQTPPSPADD